MTAAEIQAACLRCHGVGCWSCKDAARPSLTIDWNQWAVDALRGVTCDPTELSTFTHALTSVTGKAEAMRRQLGIGRMLTQLDCRRRNEALNLEWDRKAAFGVGSAERKLQREYAKEIAL